MHRLKFLAGILSALYLVPETKANIFFDNLAPVAYKNGDSLEILTGELMSHHSFTDKRFPFGLYCEKPKGFASASDNEIVHADGADMYGTHLVKHYFEVSNS